MAWKHNSMLRTGRANCLSTELVKKARWKNMGGRGRTCLILLGNAVGICQLRSPHCFFWSPYGMIVLCQYLGQISHRPNLSANIILAIVWFNGCHPQIAKQRTSHTFHIWRLWRQANNSIWAFRHSLDYIEWNNQNSWQHNRTNIKINSFS